jgi:hypothetical protein
MNAGMHIELPQENVIQHGYCRAHVVPKDVIVPPYLNLTYNHPYNHLPPKIPTPKLTI